LTEPFKKWARGEAAARRYAYSADRPGGVSRLRTSSL
jgi:hypothetical protein